MPKNKREAKDDWDDERSAFGSKNDWKDLEEGEGGSSELLSDSSNGSSKGITVDLSKDEDGEEEEVSFYTVKGEGYSIGEQKFSRGDVVPIQCQHCAFWDREISILGNKALCFDGRKAKSDGTIYSADKFSCGTFFIPKDFSEEDKFFEMSIDQLEAFRRFYTLALRTEKSKEKVRARYRKWAEKHDITVDVEETIELAEKYMFSMNEQAMKYSKQFFVKYVPKLLDRRTKSATPKETFRVGDWVYWKPTDSEDRLLGLIMGLGRGKLKLAGVGKTNKGVGYEYPFKYWKAQCEPEVHIKTVPKGETNS